MLKRLGSFFALFTSASTLVCCALPAIFVSLGAGATFAGLVTNIPQLIWLSEHKGLVFGMAAVGLIVAAYLQRLSASQVCPTDPKLAEACRTTRRNSVLVFRVSVILYLVGAFFAFVAPYFAARG
jgi:hypothetical protein